VWLFSVSILSFSETVTTQTDSSQQTIHDAATVPVEDPATARASNIAADSLERAVERAIVADFSPLGPAANAEPVYLSELGFSPDSSLFGEFLLAQTNPQNQTKPSGTSPTAPTLGDLGFPTEQTKGSAEEQARLDKRSHMLKIHQRLGLITTIPLAATLLSGGLASGKATSSSGRDIHAALGGVTTALYFTTAYYSIFAPKVPGTATRGSVRLHKALAMIHGPGMILTPILGVMAYQQKSRGERVHGLASAHGGVAAVTSIAYGLAILSVSFKF
jgi:hypothetical protein